MSMFYFVRASSALDHSYGKSCYQISNAKQYYYYYEIIATLQDLVTSSVLVYCILAALHVEYERLKMLGKDNGKKWGEKHGIGGHLSRYPNTGVIQMSRQ
jgi:hypothetical protein